MFTLGYKLFVYLKPSQLFVVILALLNKTDLKNFISIPSLFILFNTVLSDNHEPNLDSKVLQARLEVHKFINKENNWENFFWILIILAIIRRFITTIFKIFWLPFKVAMCYFVFKHLGFDFNAAYNVLNTLSLGIIEWFNCKITSFF